LPYIQDFRFYENDARGMEARRELPGITAHALEQVECRRGDDTDVDDWNDQ
jgi:hypothetical protein